MLLAQELIKDTLYGKVKEIKENVIFLTEIENPQFMYYDDYGHSGFLGSESTISRFADFWYSTESTYYLNYERKYSENGQILKEKWFGKKNDLIMTYSFEYDKNGNLLTVIEQSGNSKYLTHYFYTENGDETIIKLGSSGSFFSHKYNKYHDGKLIRSKTIDERGIVDEYNYTYDDKGNLLFSKYKNPNTWKTTDSTSWSYGVFDSIGAVYKNEINNYQKGKLINSKKFDLYSDENFKEPVMIEELKFKYEGINLIQKSQFNKYLGLTTYFNYRYDDKDRLIEKYCCDDNVSKSIQYQKYSYDSDNIIGFITANEDFITNQMVEHKVIFRYKFDKYKNWIEIVKNVDGKDLFKWKRKIKYH